MKINWNNKYATIAIYAFLVICGSILLYLGISQMSAIKSSINDFMGTLQPFIIGGALAYLLNFILRFYEDYILSHEAFNKLKKSGKRGVGLLLTYITASIITYLFIQFVLPQLMDSIIGLVNNIHTILIIKLNINKDLKTCLKILTAFFTLFAPIFLETNAPPPIANMEAKPNNITVNGRTILTAANAESPTPCPTNIPSITVYNEEINIANADGIAYLKNSFFIHISFNF